MSMSQPQDAVTDRIDVNDAAACEQWAKRLDATREEIQEAVRAVGANPSDVEAHLKGTRSSTNSDRVKEELRK